jgi:Zn-dependent M28 family amino/carboxypeptidase
MAEAPPHRSVLFLMVTGEEKGLVGSDYFAHHPTVPRESIVADINCDNFLWYFPVKDVSGVGLTYSSLETDFSAAAADVGIHAAPAVMPLNGGTPMPLIVLSDHYSFLRAGIPAVSIFNGEDSGDGKRTGSQVFADYMRDVHHTPKDSIDQAIDWSAAVVEACFALALGQRVANDPERPRFKSGAPFGRAGTRP